MRVRRDGELPVGVQLAWQLRAGILGGTLLPGSRLSSVREMAAEAGVNVNTVRAVYRELEQGGYVVSRERSGTFVAEEAPTGIDLNRLGLEIEAEAQAAGVPVAHVAAGAYVAATSGVGGAGPDDRAGSAVTSTSAGSIRDLVTEEGDQRGARATLREQIAKLEAELSNYPRAPIDPWATKPRRRTGGQLADFADLEAIRDELLRKLDAAREREAGWWRTKGSGGSES